ncbi:hypothetical protein MLD38_029276 [Melastoma candidum]|uniref:Uncharacterized protein n=1 Tax=Melastoma candidum TaxID=119954 RepID=A0ACB9N369_9MYRT|nr:hypothetical protein MLD38_029276 [Melastoma candidum]
MGNCIANNRVVSREAEDEDPRAPFTKETKGADLAFTQGGGGGGQGGSVAKKKKMEKRVSFKLEDDGDKEGVAGGEKRGDLGNRKGVTRRVKVVVTKEELRRILEYAERSSSPDSSSSGLEELIMSLRSSRSGGRVCSNGDGNALSPGLECIPQHRH